MKNSSNKGQQQNDDPVWRYTSLAKFLNTLRRSDIDGHGELIAKRADELEDEYEGTLPSSTKQIIREEVTEFFIDQSMGDYDPSDILASPDKLGVDEYPEWNASSAADNAIESYQRARKLTFLNCWRLDDYESSNMWKAYTTPTDGIVVRSSIDALNQAVADYTGNIWIDNVSYEDYSNGIHIDELIDPFFYKRKEFTDESEVRVVVSDVPDGVSGLIGYGADALPDPTDETIRPISYDMTELVDEIRVHPQAGSYMNDLVDEALNKFDLDVPVKDSSLC